ncbi:MAG: 5-formyltetrahydrofolate cyclo-ligase [Verrucomicrobia bacterium RIFCSPHIGHO2_12_FULL_41_10]|nr:MAG: 5-formyltetrahydrofolate cyclo-ligase [Verrucomicrobia bacterium RIFCSPHIGHO2_12_FULL_41_10]HLB33497.1 5-formyltetrahydrofolate cyclo-ligase [Chthoniobacterales bacterium]
MPCIHTTHSQSNPFGSDPSSAGGDLNAYKQQLRKKMIALHQQKTSSLLSEELLPLLKQLYSLSEWKKAQSVLLYAPMFGEPNLLELLKENSERRFLFPRIHNNNLSLHQWDHEAPWSHGTFGIPEPDPRSQHWPLVPIEEVDLALIPGVAFDLMGGRLGRGYGFFDRLLGTPTCVATKIGIAWPWQIIPEVPREPWDVLMNLVITANIPTKRN